MLFELFRVEKCALKYLIFTLLWVLFELYHIELEISYPLLSLGVVLGNITAIIQWYSITGILGGALWILLVNFILLEGVKKKKLSAFSYMLIFFPVAISASMLLLDKDEGQKSFNVVACSLKLDDEADAFERSLALANNAIDSDTDLILCPEALLYLTATSFPINKYFFKIKKMLKEKSKHASIIFGSNTNNIKEYAFRDSSRYNMAIQCDTVGFVGIRNKMLLVPFGEFIPYEKVLGKIGVIKRVVEVPFSTNREFDNTFMHSNVEILPLICYEICFSSLIRKYYSNNSIGLICCISNEYAVPNKTYYTQLTRISKIQAISFKTPVVKSTVNGYSSIITKTGKMVSTSYNTDEALKGIVTINPEKTFYAKNGYLAVFLLLALSLVIIIFIKP